MKKQFFMAMISSLLPAIAFTQGRVGINTVSPQAMLHVKDSSVLFSGATSLPSVTPPPVSGQGIRMMWYPVKAAFRVGFVSNTNWDKDSIGNYSLAAGYNTKAFGFGDVAFGNQASATGGASFAYGSFTSATGNASTAHGFTTKATNSYSTAMGAFTEASGYTSTAMGYGTVSDGYASTSLGYNTTALANYSAVMGNQTVAKSFSGTVIGLFNDSAYTPNASGISSTNRIFEIGNGFSR